MATYKVIIRKITTESGDPIISGPSPIAFRDRDETIAWIEGEWLDNGSLAFNIPDSLPSGLKIGVLTDAGMYTEDDYLSGNLAGDGSENLGMYLVPAFNVG